MLIKIVICDDDKEIIKDSFSVGNRILLPLLFLTGGMTAGVTYFQYVEREFNPESLGDRIGAVFASVVGFFVYITYLSLIYTINSARAI